jgi:hypothetical protein
LIREGGDTRIADGNRIERLEVMDDVEGTALLLDAEPAGVVQGIGALVDSRGELLLEHLYYVV